MMSALAHVDCWIFDLDNTLYHPRADLFGRIDERMGLFIQKLLDLDPVEARRVQKGFFLSHGTTLAGLMEHHDVDPNAFLDFVHDIDMSALAEDRRLVAAIGRLPGRKLIFTNGDAPHAQRVLERLGLNASFEAIHDIHACGYLPKPAEASYRLLCERLHLDPRRALFVEDMARNLKPAKALGMTTVWINNGSEHGGHDAAADFIDYEIADLGDWLEEVLGE